MAQLHCCRALLINIMKGVKNVVDEETCGIRSVFSDVRSETVKMLKQATLAEIIKRSESIKKEITLQKKTLKKKK
jgi:DNA-binding IscR family transcriptional regulator